MKREELIRLLESNELHIGFADLVAGIDDKRKDAQLRRFFDPFGLFSDPSANTSMFKPRDAFPAKRVMTYPDLVDFDLRNDLGGQSRWNDETVHHKKLPVARNVVNRVKVGHNIPRVMSFLWMGGPFTKNRGWKEVESFAENPGEYPNVILWTDVPRGEVREAYANKGQSSPRAQGIFEMVSWCIAHDIWLVNVDEAFHGANAMSCQALFNLCRATRLWGAASDIFRYELLFRLGGGYSDIDNECRAHYKKLEAFYTKVPQAKTHRFAMCTHNTTPTMAALFSTPGNPIVGDILRHVEGQFRKTKEQVITQDAPYANLYRIGFQAYLETSMHDVLARTGPNAFFTALFASVLGKYTFPAAQRKSDPVLPSQVGSEIAEAIFLRKKGSEYYPTGCSGSAIEFLRVSTIPKDRLEIDSAGTWVSRKMVPMDTVADCRIALTVLLYALVSDPKTLDLTVFGFRGMTALQLVRAVQKYYSALLDGVERVYMLPQKAEVLERVRKLLGSDFADDWVTETDILRTRNHQEDGRVLYRDK